LFLLPSHRSIYVAFARNDYLWRIKLRLAIRAWRFVLRAQMSSVDGGTIDSVLTPIMQIRQYMHSSQSQANVNNDSYPTGKIYLLEIHLTLG
jgi:hypothetical protein